MYFAMKKFWDTFIISFNLDSKCCDLLGLEVKLNNEIGKLQSLSQQKSFSF